MGVAKAVNEFVIAEGYTGEGLALSDVGLTRCKCDQQEWPSVCGFCALFPFAIFALIIVGCLDESLHRAFRLADARRLLVLSIRLL